MYRELYCIQHYSGTSTTVNWHFNYGTGMAIKISDVVTRLESEIFIKMSVRYSSNSYVATVLKYTLDCTLVLVLARQFYSGGLLFVTGISYF